MPFSQRLIGTSPSNTDSDATGCLSRVYIQATGSSLTDQATTNVATEIERFVDGPTSCLYLRLSTDASALNLAVCRCSAKQSSALVDALLLCRQDGSPG